MITPKEIEILIKNDWEIVSENPLKFIRYAQFAGGVHEMETEEDFREELKAIEITEKNKQYYKELKKENTMLSDIHYFVDKLHKSKPEELETTLRQLNVLIQSYVTYKQIKGEIK